MDFVARFHRLSPLKHSFCKYLLSLQFFGDFPIDAFYSRAISNSLLYLSMFHIKLFTIPLNLFFWNQFQKGHHLELHPTCSSLSLLTSCRVLLFYLCSMSDNHPLFAIPTANILVQPQVASHLYPWNQLYFISLQLLNSNIVKISKSQL